MNWRTAVITLVGALFSFAVTFATGVIPLIHDVTDRDGAIAERDREIESRDQELASARATLEARQDAIDALRDENTELRASLPYTVAPEDVADIRATATITLARNGDTVDLNSTLPNFRASGHVWQDTLTYNGEMLELGYETSSRKLEENADYSTCAAATGWAKDPRLDPHDLMEPLTCLRLVSERYAAIRVLRYDENSAEVVITVWE